MTDSIHAERRAFRAGRVRLAFLTSAGSKALGLIVQFLAFPLAVRSLGPERFGIYIMLVSALVWIDLGRLGIGPGLTRELAIAWNRGERERERVLFSNAMFLLLGIAAFITVLLVAAFAVGMPYIDTLFGASGARFHSEIVTSIVIVGTFLVAQVVFSIGEAARSAYQDDFINNLMSSLENLASLLMIFWVALFWPTVPGFALAVFGSMVLGKGVNVVLLLVRSRRYLFPRWRYVSRAELRPLVASSLAFWVVQIAVLMMHNLSILQLGHLIGAGGLTPFAIVFRLLQLLSTGVLMISMPLWPAITDAVVRGDRDWIVKAYRRLIGSAMAFCTLVAIGLTLFGPALIPLWAGSHVRPGPALNAVLGVYFVIWMWNHCHATVLFGLGRLWAVAWITFCEGALVLVLGSVLVPRYGVVGTGLALCIAGLAVTAWTLPLIVRRALARPLHLAPSDLPPAGPVGALAGEAA